MNQTFERDGVRFRYPADWKLEFEPGEAEGAWAVSIQSPETAFVLISLHPEAENPAELADLTLEALKTEYKELDADDVVETVAGSVAVGHDLDFLTIDTSITCWTRCLETPAGPLLVMGQAAERERLRHEPALLAVRRSLEILEE